MMVLPCPGASAWMLPRSKDTAIAAMANQGVWCRLATSDSKRFVRLSFERRGASVGDATSRSRVLVDDAADAVDAGWVSNDALRRWTGVLSASEG